MLCVVCVFFMVCRVRVVWCLVSLVGTLSVVVCLIDVVCVVGLVWCVWSVLFIF